MMLPAVLVTDQSSEAGSRRGWPEKDASPWSLIGARRPAHAVGGLRKMRRVKARPTSAPRDEPEGLRSHPAQRADDPIGKEQDGAHEQPAEEDQPEIRIACRQPALDPVHSDGADD